jgi:hypothetical protein
MAERRYLWFHIKNHTPRSMVEIISNQVRQYRLGTVIPRLCYERPEKKNQREFHLFLAVVNEAQDDLPLEVKNLIGRLHLTPMGSFAYDDIKSMTTRELDIENYARQIDYHPAEVPQFDDPLSLYRGAHPPTLQSALAYDHLLYWLSAVGSGSWELFRTACRNLKLDETGNEAKRILRRLRLLGHVEYVADNSKWYVCPPCLVQLGANIKTGYRYFLAGQRSHKLEEVLGASGQLEVIPQSDLGAPACIYVTFDSAQSAREAVSRITNEEKICELRLVNEPSKYLAHILPDTAGWQASLRPLRGVLPELYTIERWQDGDFVKLADREMRSGFYRLTRSGIAINPPQYTLFYEQRTDQWLQGDWYGLRYLAIRHLNQECPVLYLTDTCQLVIPRDYRWPDLYERALVLASGQLPRLSNHGYVFEQISSDLLEELARKLSVTIYKETSNE